MRQCLIALDDEMHILQEYSNNLSISGQPGPGDFFMQWVWDNQANPQHCEKVHITPKDEGGEDYEEFPQDPELGGFDRSDRKFVAVARASAYAPRILNATDTDWWHYRAILARHGVVVEFLCPGLMTLRTQ